ncbi:serum response factor-binding protein 1 [Poecilia reticulata]|uniref:serum response factor-binding protein 1 n=1 Tax=Poecilia reticulata TaxID=8081 RepID=UPI0004A28EDA|nr:PREDICTED: serum response factor-binding protein 1 [Poecilia reticulata]XP_008419634.1 PREDICTED: serum response factor-binding protein 1 [Poecilia reticulata]XP_008419635.1 PREDICTED: serum response factor-binding protein 1 [Poecilia reticulata]
MINTEKTFPPVEEQEQDEMEEEDEDEEEEEEATSSDNNNDDEEEEAGGEKEAEPSSAATEKKPSDVLNLNNEVVKMRKEVKRVKALIIRKLTRQIVTLKRKKGKEAEMERNQRRAARLLEEVHSMKKLALDGVTKTALQKDLNFERVCKNPKSTMLERAMARIASHPQFRKKIESIRAAVKDFREERTKARKQEEHPKGQRQPEKATQLSPVTRQDRKNEDKDKDNPLNQQVEDTKEGADVFKGAKKSVVQSPATSDVPKQEKPESTSAKSTLVKSSTKPKPQIKHEENSRLQSVPELALESADEEESDVESSDDEEKEYFDDSTEERFHKQSSASEESDEDDFFIGKVSKFKKKKKETSGEAQVDKEREGKKDLGDPKTNKLQSQLDELESRLKSKPLTVQSVFCSSLAGRKGGRGGDKGKGTGKSGAPGNSKTGGGLNDGGSGKLKFTKQENRTSNSGAKFSKRPESDRKESGSAGRGRGKDVRKQMDNRGRGFLSHQPSQPALHPSWEASKKRKEQQGQILAFQGKKIKFDDDDD